MLKNYLKPAAAIGLVLILTASLLSGCKDAEDKKAEPDTRARSGSAAQHAHVSDKSDAAAKTTTSSTGEQAHPSKNDADTKKEGNFRIDKPALVGISLGDKKDAVNKKLGKPADTYTMDDESEPLKVWEYEGFSIGFNGSDYVAFIDIDSEDVDPGLNGVRIGSKSSAAVKALGKPDTNTEVVISYSSKTAVLKLDIDPKLKTVLSIKLFAADKT